MNLLHKIAPAFKTLDNLAEQLANQAETLRAFADEKRSAAEEIRRKAQLDIDRANIMIHESRVADLLADDISRTLERAEVEPSVMV